MKLKFDYIFNILAVSFALIALYESITTHEFMKFCVYMLFSLTFMTMADVVKINNKTKEETK